ncbi:Glutathione-dependent formaldehyde-activating enzyme/centromere protein V [Mycena chlorophos]|uniref:Glutathione-dependent formaldehyde-activating enzyme/centromere protein V n=1 Tax=Mycena chlorophos TaxID=658473 RepID=A0A8H6T523_MYCCL|nr:Glutathione-dependent formaldehyde-activating enzyme/centromere protein V [Mycena chlorophos]
MSCFSIFRAKGDRAGVAPKPAHRRGGSDSTLIGADSTRTNKKPENKKRGAAQLPTPKFDTVLDKAKAIFMLAHVAPVRAPVILDRKKADQKKTKRTQKTTPKPKHVEDFKLTFFRPSRLWTGDSSAKNPMCSAGSWVFDADETIRRRATKHGNGSEDHQYLGSRRDGDRDVFLRNCAALIRELSQPHLREQSTAHWHDHGCDPPSHQPTEAPGLVASFLCHCADCKKVSATTMGANFVIDDKYLVHVRGQERLKTYAHSHTVASGNMMSNYFCENCGTLMYRVSAAFPTLPALRIGTVDELELHGTKFRPTLEQFTKDRVAWSEPIQGMSQHEASYW